MKILKQKWIKKFIVFLILFILIYLYAYFRMLTSSAFLYTKKYFKENQTFIKEYGNIEEIYLVPFGAKLKEGEKSGYAKFSVILFIDSETKLVQIELNKSIAGWKLKNIKEK